MTKISPASMPAKIDPVKKRGRAYGLGERNPDTLPGSGKYSETEYENAVRTAHWRKVRKLVQANRLTGAKY